LHRSCTREGFPVQVSELKIQVKDEVKKGKRIIL